MLLRLLALIFPLSLAADTAILQSFTIDLSSLSYPQLTADSQGNVVVAGFARSCALPTVSPISTCGPLWIGKFDPSGQTLLFATYLGDSAADFFGFSSTAGFCIQADPNGNIVMLSSANKAALPVVNPIQSVVNGRTSLYIFKLAADGSHLIYATYLGGSNYEVPVSLAVDAAGAAYILDSTNSSDFPATPQAINSTVYGRSAVLKLTADGALEYSASFPWVYTMQPITVDSSGAVTLVEPSARIWKLSPDATRLDSRPIPPTLNGFYYYPFVWPVSDGGLWITGSTGSSTIPVTPDAFQPVTGPSPYVRIENGVANVPFRIPAHAIADFAVDASDPNRVYAATDGGLFASTDNGRSWNLLIDAVCRAIVVDPYDSNTLYLGTVIEGPNGAGLYRSSDRGQRWQPQNLSRLSGSGIISLAVDPNVPGLVYALSTAFYRSLDHGQTWTAAALPPSIGNGGTPSSTYYYQPQTVRADPVHPYQVFVSGVDRCIGFCPVIADVIRSTDGGESVSKLRIPYASNAPGLSIDPATGDVYALNGKSSSVLRAANSYNPETLALDVTAIAFDSASPGVIDAALADGSIVRSVDAGATWNPVVQLPASAAQLAVSADGVLHASQPASTYDAYAVRYDAAGNVTYGTYLSGGATTTKTSAVTSFDHLLIAGTTGPDLPLLNPVQPSYGGGTDGFFAEFDSHGTLLSSTYLGGSGMDEVDSIVPLPDGSALLIGVTKSPEFAATLAPSAIGAGSTFVLRVK